MFAALSKIAALPFYPLGAAVVLSAAGTVFLFLKRHAAGRILVICSISVLWLFSADPLSHLLVRSLEKTYDPPAVFPAAPATVLLCGGEAPLIPPRVYDEVNEAGDRIIFAARLVKQGVAPRLIVAGGRAPFMRDIGSSLARANQRLLAGPLGVDSSIILLEEESRNTFESAVFTKKIFDSLGLPADIILVTSAMHMPRSAALFRKAGFRVFPAPADYRALVPFRPALTDLLPNAAALENSTCALHEIYGIIAYKLLGRL